MTKKALVDPQRTASYISSWKQNLQTNEYTPIYSEYENSQLICDVELTSFEVCPPLFWVNCNDNVIAYEFYLDTTNNEIKQIINAPYPAENSSTTTIINTLETI